VLAIWRDSCSASNNANLLEKSLMKLAESFSNLIIYLNFGDSRPPISIFDQSSAWSVANGCFSPRMTGCVASFRKKLLKTQKKLRWKKKKDKVGRPPKSWISWRGVLLEYSFSYRFLSFSFEFVREACVCFIFRSWIILSIVWANHGSVETSTTTRRVKVLCQNSRKSLVWLEGIGLRDTTSTASPA